MSHRPLRRLAVLALALFALLASAAGVMAQGDGNGGMVARLIASLLSGEGRQVTIGDVDGALTGDTMIRNVRVSDDRGTFLTIDRMHLVWRPTRLIAREFAVNALDISNVTLLRAPAPPPPAQRSAEPFTFELPSLPVDVRVDAFSVERVALEEPVLGTAASLAVNGNMRLGDPSQGLSLMLEVRRTDTIDGRIALDFAYVPDGGRLDVDLSAEEPAGGLIARLLDLAELPPLSASVSGDGTLDAFRATLSARAGADAKLDGNATIERVANGHRVGFDLTGAIAPLLPERVAPLAPGATHLAGSAVIGPERTISIEQVALESAALSASIGGSIGADGTLALRYDATAGDRARFAGLLPPDIGWRALHVTGTLEGQPSQPAVTARIDGRGLTGPSLALETLSGSLRAALSGPIGDETSETVIGADLTAGAIDTTSEALDRLLGATARLRLEGRYARSSGLLIDSAGLTGEGAAVSLSGRAGSNGYDLEADLGVRDLTRIAPAITGALSAQARLTGAAASPAATMSATIAEGTLNGRPLRDVRLTAEAADLLVAPSGRFSLSGRFEQTPTTASAVFAVPSEGGLVLDDLSVDIPGLSASGALRIATEGAGGTVRIASSDLAPLGKLAGLDLAGTLEGTVAMAPRAGTPTLTADVTARDVGLATSHLARLSVALSVADPARAPRVTGEVQAEGGTLAGRALERARLSLSGPLEALAASFDARLAGTELAAAALLEEAGGVRRLAIERLSAERGGTRLALAEPTAVRLEEAGPVIEPTVLASGNGRLTLSGRAGEALALDIAAERLPLSLAALADIAGLGGTLSGSTHIAGSPSAPTGDYRLQVTGLSHPVLARSGIGALGVTASGRLDPGRIGINGHITGPASTTINVEGGVALSDEPGLDFKVTGSAGLGLAAASLPDGDSISGTASIDARITGTAAAPQVAGSASIANGGYASAGSGLSLSNIRASLAATGQTIRIERFTASTAGGGTVVGTGTVTLDPARGLPAELSIELDRAHVETAVLQSDVDADITVAGPLARAPRIGGRIDLVKTEISVPESLPVSLAPVEVTHLHPPAAIADRVARERRAREEAAKRGPPFNAVLDLRIAALNRVFVRGRGIDAEFSGDLRLGGTSQDPQAIGALTLRRGTLTVLSQRLDLTRGQITFLGGLDPELNIAAETRAGDVTAIIEVTGNASQPQFRFTSNPQLPQDEVLARLLFNRASSDLTPGQALQLAQAVAELTGVTSGPGVLERLRRSLGVDRLDVSLDPSGSPTVAVGRYIDENISVGVEQGANANSTRFTVDVDITRDIRARAKLGSDGSSALGLSWQKDY